MANLWFKNILGQIPATEKLESSRNQLIEEQKRHQEIAQSDLLKEYEELKAYIESDEFQQKKKEIEAIKFSGSEEEKLINEFTSLQKDKSIQLYFKTLESNELKRFEEIQKSEKLERYNEIKETVESGQIEELKKQMDADHKAEKEKAKRFKALKKHPDLKKYFKLINSPGFKTYQDIKESEKLKNFYSLKEAVESFDYNKINKENESEYSEQIDQRNRYQGLQKDGELKVYFKFVNAGHPEFIDQTSSGELMNEYEALEIYLQSDEYQEKLKETDFKTSDLYKLQQEYKQLQKDPDIKFYHKFEQSKAYKNYIAVKESDKLKRYYELKEQTEDPAFRDKVEYLRDDKKFEKTEEYKSLAKYKELEQNDDLKWYFKVTQEDRFKELRKWETIFSEDFDNAQLNKDVWSPVVFAGMMTFNDNYVTKGEKQFFTKGENLHIDHSALNIETKKEHTKGKSWSKKHGFMEEEFDFTSGTLNTAQAFRFNQGKIEAKVSLQQPGNIVHGLSLKGEKITPHIDLLKTGKGSGYEVRYIPKEDQTHIISHKIKGINLNDKYFIHSLEWNDSELIWSLNNIEVARATHQLNGEELYISLASIVEKQPENLPANFSIDWIKVYKKQEAE